MNRALTSLHGNQLKLHLKSLYHSCMPSPLVPDPIRVQSCDWCLFWTNRNFYLSHHHLIRDESLNRRYTLNGHIIILYYSLKVSLQINFMLKGKYKASINLCFITANSTEGESQIIEKLRIRLYDFVAPTVLILSTRKRNANFSGNFIIEIQNILISSDQYLFN